MTSSSSSKRWLITGVSSGFGNELARAALARGDVVVGTVRQPEQASRFEALAPGRAHAVLLDVTRADAIEPAVREAISRAGQIDVLVNNAGYGLFGAVEEVSDAEARAVMETNFFGALAVTRALIPHLRERRTGHVFNVSSVAGVLGIPGGALYSASKFALEGLSEALVGELRPFGIRVTLVEPGGFRTNFAGGSLRQAARVVEAYADTPAGKTRVQMGQYAGHEPGDPAKAARAILQVADAPNPPVRLVLGQDAVDMVRRTYAAALKDVDEWEPVSAATALDA
ncbi:oxidoreductase [Ideonella sp. B508-1]|uniref:oxidoreductase n=1 Tax=Ideonella sp. B508-1 TaxID=137716 RepID=UPI000346BA43|nr:oxidoreductase [Ideonella sp. B508-1]